MNGLPPFKRNTPLVFQEYALFPHMTVYENISYGLKLKKAPKEEKDRKVAEMLEMFNLQGLDGRFPKQLSGGQQQRVAFARALVMGQEILLLDEPLSNLDAKLRVEVRTELRQIQQKFGITTMYVTHDQDEALSMSDIIAVMRRGRIEQIGSPWEIYFRPATRFVADFVGTVNFLEGTAHREADGSLSVDHRGMRLRVDEDTDLQGGEPVTLVVRPEGISLMGLEETVPEGTALRGTIENYSFLGRMIRYWVRVGEEVFVIDDANVDPHRRPDRGCAASFGYSQAPRAERRWCGCCWLTLSMWAMATRSCCGRRRHPSPCWWTAGTLASGAPDRTDGGSLRRTTCAGRGSGSWTCWC